jgi:hypothetical protein
MCAFGQALEICFKMYVERCRLLPTTRTQTLGYDAPRNARPTPEYVEAVVVGVCRDEMSVSGHVARSPATCTSRRTNSMLIFGAHTSQCGLQITGRSAAIVGFALRGASSSQPQEPSTSATCIEGCGMGLNAQPFVSSSYAERGYQTRQGQGHALSRMLVFWRGACEACAVGGARRCGG